MSHGFASLLSGLSPQKDPWGRQHQPCDLFWHEITRRGLGKAWSCAYEAAGDTDSRGELNVKGHQEGTGLKFGWEDWDR